jgi:hypothetical protein
MLKQLLHDFHSAETYNMIVRHNRYKAKTIDKEHDARISWDHKYKTITYWFHLRDEVVFTYDVILPNNNPIKELFERFLEGDFNIPVHGLTENFRNYLISLNHFNGNSLLGLRCAHSCVDTFDILVTKGLPPRCSRHGIKEIFYVDGDKKRISTKCSTSCLR